MSSSMPLVLQLPRRALVRRDAVRQLVSAVGLDRFPRRFSRAMIEAAFDFKDEELPFARALAERTQLWIFRSNQRAFAGDFVVVDVSSPWVVRRPVIAIDLKRGQPVREGRQGIQMRDTSKAMRELAHLGIVAPARTPTHVTGDARALLRGIDELLARARKQTAN